MEYYHPKVAARTIDRDSVFVANVPAVVKAENKNEFDSLMDGLYSLVPAPKLAPNYNLPEEDTVMSVFPVKETANYTVGAKLKQKLVNLYEQHLPVERKYIT